MREVQVFRESSWTSNAFLANGDDHNVLKEGDGLSSSTSR